MKKGLITSILALTFTGLQAQPLPATPKLVVTLTIDQLRTDYMEAFSSLYGEKGFKRLMREGKVFYQTEFPFSGRQTRQTGKRSRRTSLRKRNRKISLRKRSRRASLRNRKNSRRTRL